MNASETKTTYLLIDDDAIFRKRLARAVSDRGNIVYEAESPSLGIEIAASKKPSRILLDLRMPEMSGVDALREIKSVSKDSKVVILTGYGSIATALETIKEGAVNYLSKPVDVERILAAFDSQKEAISKQPDNVPSLDEVQWEHIERVMTECGGNITKAAQMLGLHRRSLQRKLKSPPKK